MLGRSDSLDSLSAKEVLPMLEELGQVSFRRSESAVCSGHLTCPLPSWSTVSSDVLTSSDYGPKDAIGVVVRLVSDQTRLSHHSQ